MKKIFLFIVSTTIVVFVFGQKPKFTWGNPTNSNNIEIISKNNEVCYFYELNKNSITVGELKKDLKTGAENTITLDDEEKFEFGYGGSNDISIITSVANEKDNTLTIFRYGFDKNNLSKFQKTTCLKLNYGGKREYKFLYFTKSKENIGILFLQIGKKNMAAAVTVYCMNNEMEEKWYTEIKPSLKNRHFSLSQFYFDNDGDLLVIGDSFLYDEHLGRTQMMHIMKVNPAQYNQYDVEIDAEKDILGVETLQNINNNYVIAGFYRGLEDQDSIKGTFSILINKETKKVENTVYNEVVPNFDIKNERARLSICIIGMTAMDNGNVILFAEPFYTVISYSPAGGINIKYYSYNLFAMTIDKDGDILNTTIINKNQEVNQFKSQQSTAGSIVVSNGEKVCVLFNDNIKNHDHKIQEKKKKTYKFSNKKSSSAIILIELMETGEIEGKYIFPSKETSRLLLRNSAYFTDDGRILFKLKSNAIKSSYGQIELEN